MPLYVSPVAGHIATRFGTGNRTTPAAQIGVSKTPKGELAWDEALITPIPDAEVAQFRREYDRLLADGALRKRTEAEYQAWLTAHREAEKEALAKEAEKGSPAAAKPAGLQPALTLP